MKTKFRDYGINLMAVILSFVVVLAVQKAGLVNNYLEGVIVFAMINIIVAMPRPNLFLHGLRAGGRAHGQTDGRTDRRTDAPDTPLCHLTCGYVRLCGVMWGYVRLCAVILVMCGYVRLWAVVGKLPPGNAVPAS